MMGRKTKITKLIKNRNLRETRQELRNLATKTVIEVRDLKDLLKGVDKGEDEDNILLKTSIDKMKNFMDGYGHCVFPLLPRKRKLLCPDISPLFLSLISELRGYLLPVPLVALALLSSLSLSDCCLDFLFHCFIFPTSAYLRKL